MTIHSFFNDAEVRLVETLSTLRDDTIGWRVVHLRFSRLGEQYKSDYQARIAASIIADFMKDAEGYIYVCWDFDIFVICKGVTKQLIDKTIFRLRYLFTDDPLAYGQDGEENPAFCSIYDLSVAWGNVNDLAKTKLVEASKRDVLSRRATVRLGEDEKIRPLTPDRLSSITKDIETADLSRVMRRQPICAAVRGSKQIRRVFDEFYINIAHLRRLVMANVDFLSNRWLFKYMTEILDAKMLDMLSRRPADYFDRPISLNLNVDTLLSDKFAAFDEAIKPSIKVSIVIEIQASDVFADMSAFLIAREMVQKMGYRVCLDGLTDKSFPLLDREELGFDLAKIQWNTDLIADTSSNHSKKLIKMIKQCGANRIILCRCDTDEALSYGHQFGISLFQGRYLDSVLNPDAKVVN